MLRDRLRRLENHRRLARPWSRAMMAPAMGRYASDSARELTPQHQSADGHQHTKAGERVGGITRHSSRALSNQSKRPLPMPPSSTRSVHQLGRPDPGSSVVVEMDLEDILQVALQRSHALAVANVQGLDHRDVKLACSIFRLACGYCARPTQAFLAAFPPCRIGVAELSAISLSLLGLEQA